MSIGHNPKIVKDGLVLALDVANVKSYPGTGTTWNNLSINANNATLVNGVTYNSANKGYLSFDGVDDRVTSSFSTTSGQAVTYAGWLYSTETAATYRNFVDSASQKPMIWWNTAGQIEFDATLYTTPTVYRNQWVYVCLSKPAGSSAASYYVNGVLVGTGTAYTTSPSTTGRFGLGHDSGTTGSWNGKMDQFRIYGKQLTANQLLKNYQATKNRYV